MTESYTHDQLVAGMNDPTTGANIDAVTMIINDLVKYFAPRIEEDQQLVDLELENMSREREGDEPIEEYIRRYEKIRFEQLNEGRQQFFLAPSCACHTSRLWATRLPPSSNDARAAEPHSEHGSIVPTTLDGGNHTITMAIP